MVRQKTIKKEFVSHRWTVSQQDSKFNGTGPFDGEIESHMKDLVSHRWTDTGRIVNLNLKKGTDPIGGEIENHRRELISHRWDSTLSLD